MRRSVGGIGSLSTKDADRSRASAGKVSATINRSYKTLKQTYDTEPKRCQCEKPWGEGEDCLYCGKPVA